MVESPLTDYFLGENDPAHAELHQKYMEQKHIIDKFLDSVSDRELTRDEIMFELAFCLCTPQSKAAMCREAVRNLKATGLLWDGTKEQVLNYLTGVRFNDKKSSYIIQAREQLDGIYAKITEMKDKPHGLRQWLADNVMGFGYKEASHFLRNIGLGEDLGIMDVHVLRQMARLGLITENVTKDADGNFAVEGGLSPKKYLEYEKKFRALANKLGFSVLELDSTIWLSASGSKELM